MALQLPSVGINDDVTLFQNNAQTQTLQAPFDNTTMQLKTLASIVGAIDSFNVRHDTAVANEARIEMSKLAATELTDFQVNNRNPQEGDFDKVVASLKEKQNKVLEKYGIDNLDWRVRTKFYDDHLVDNGRFEANIASSMIEKRYQADLHTINTQLANSINESQMYYNDPNAVENFRQQAIEATEAKGRLNDWSADVLEFEKLRSSSLVDLTVGLTAHKTKRMDIVSDIVKNKHKAMIDDDWRKLKGLLDDYNNANYLSSAKIDPVLAHSRARDALFARYTEADFKQLANERGVSLNEARDILYNQSDALVTQIRTQKMKESDIEYVPIANVKPQIEKFINTNDIKAYNNPEDKLMAILSLSMLGVDVTQSPNVNQQERDLIMSQYQNIVGSKFYKDEIVPMLTGFKPASNPNTQKAIINEFEAYSDDYLDLNEKDRSLALRQQGADEDTINYINRSVRAKKLKRESQETLNSFKQTVSTWLYDNNSGKYNPLKGSYDLLLSKDVAKSKHANSAGKEADRYFTALVVEKLKNKLDVDTLTDVEYAAARNGALFVDADGNLTPEILEARKQTIEYIDKKYSVARKGDKRQIVFTPNQYYNLKGNN